MVAESRGFPADVPTRVIFSPSILALVQVSTRSPSNAFALVTSQVLMPRRYFLT
ncbi:hypothetical protein FM113_16935 [Leucobacter sp. 7(1)]|nr:hypothetical protein FM113_16935 [Leucobacter sp. 7(1)]